MRPLSLDFVQALRPSAAGWVLLLLGGLLLLASLLLWQWLAGERQQLAAQLHQERPQASAAAGPARSASVAQDAALLEMQRVSVQLRRPWEQLFASLEALPREDIAWLSLTPDARKGLLRISAEARDLEAMLAFHRRLEQSPGLSDVSLLNHQVLADHPGRPVLFNLQARWEVSDGRL